MNKTIIIIICILNILGLIVFIINIVEKYENIENYSVSVENKVKNIMLGQNINLRDPTNSEIMILKNKTLEIDNSTKIYNKIYKLPWKFKIITEKIDAFFTYNDYIYIPYHKIDTITKNTLLHEKIHVLQRKYKEYFDNFYKNVLNYESKPVKLTGKWNDKYLINPDALDINWIFKENDKYYLPLLLKDFKKVVILLDENFNTTNKSYNFTDFIFFEKYVKDRFIDLYHPNEMTACMISHKIYGNYNNNDIDILLSKFK